MLQVNFAHLLAPLSALCARGSGRASCPFHRRSKSPCPSWMRTSGGTGSRWRDLALPTYTELKKKNIQKTCEGEEQRSIYCFTEQVLRTKDVVQVAAVRRSVETQAGLRCPNPIDSGPDATQKLSCLKFSHQGWNNKVTHYGKPECPTRGNKKS